MKEELSDSELEGVSGGTLSYDYTFPYVYDLSYDFQSDMLLVNKA